MESTLTILSEHNVVELLKYESRNIRPESVKIYARSIKIAGVLKYQYGEITLFMNGYIGCHIG